MSQRLIDGRDVFIGGGETVLECESIEEHQASNTEGGGAVFLLVGTGDDVGDATRYPSVFGNLIRRLFQRVPNRTCGSGYSVHAFQFQWKSAQLVGKLCDGPAPYAWLWRRHPARPMQPPSEVRSGLKTSVRVLLMSKAVGIKNANHSKCFGKVFQALFELTIQEIGRAIPFAFQDHQIPTSQLDADIGSASPAATLCPGRYAVVAEGLGEKDINAFLTDGFRIVLSCRHCRDCRSQWVAAQVP